MLMLNFSSIGMAKAALEAMNGFNLYGDQGSNWSVVYVDVVRIKMIINLSHVNVYLNEILGCS